jgi:hypothetical protein
VEGGPERRLTCLRLTRTPTRLYIYHRESHERLEGLREGEGGVLIASRGATTRR